jgi:hypothetical protein
VREDANDVVVVVARDLVARTAPQELPLFRATSAAYLDDPDSVLRARTPKDEVLGFGVGEAVVLITPAALEIAKAVVSFLASQVRSAVEAETSDAIKARVHDLFRRDRESAPDAGTAPGSPALTDEQLRRVHDLALEKARALDVPEPRAALLADAMVGSLVAA